LPAENRPGGCAQTTPGNTFVVRNAVIEDSGWPHGYMYPLKQYGPNFTFRAEYRYVPAPGVTEDQDFYGNSAICCSSPSTTSGPGRSKSRAARTWK
jgi:hypothetical protein